MFKERYKTIFEGHYSSCGNEFEMLINLYLGKMIRGIIDYALLEVDAKDSIEHTEMNIKRFQEEIARTKKVLSEPCSGYLRHRLYDWLEYVQSNLKHDLELYEEYKLQLLLYFHYLVD